MVFVQTIMRRVLILIAALAAAPRGGHAARIRVSLFLPLTYEDGTVPMPRVETNVGSSTPSTCDGVER